MKFELLKFLKNGMLPILLLKTNFSFGNLRLFEIARNDKNKT